MSASHPPEPLAAALDAPLIGAPTAGAGLRFKERRALLFAGSLLVGLVSVVFALWLWSLSSGVPFSLPYLREQAGWFVVLVPAWFLLGHDLRDPRVAASTEATAPRLLVAAASGLFAYLAVYFFAAPGLLPRLLVVYFLWCALLLEILWRVAYVKVFGSSYFQRRVVVVGSGRPAATILRTLAEMPRQYAVLGIATETDKAPPALAVEAPVVAGPRTLPDTVRRLGVREIVLAAEVETRGELFKALLECQEAGIDVVRMPLLYEEVTGRVPVEDLAPDWILTSFADNVRLNDAGRVFRRVFDVLGALGGLLALSLVLPFVWLVIRLEGGGPLFFRQARTGLLGRRFLLLKFRTMVADAEADGQPRWASPGDARVTRIGRLLRRTRLDELPQFVNVLRGEMSLVGPRPERPEFIAMLEGQIPFYRARLLVKPGITGWAQINYRYGASVEDALAKLQYDLYYVKNQSLWLDLTILARTIAVVLGREGV